MRNLRYASLAIAAALIAGCGWLEDGVDEAPTLPPATPETADVVLELTAAREATAGETTVARLRVVEDTVGLGSLTLRFADRLGRLRLREQAATPPGIALERDATAAAKAVSNQPAPGTARVLTIAAPNFEVIEDADGDGTTSVASLGFDIDRDATGRIELPVEVVEATDAAGNVIEATLRRPTLRVR